MNAPDNPHNVHKLPVVDETAARQEAAERAAALRVTAADGSVEPAIQGAKIAPWPLVDRYPVVVGSNLTMAYLTSTFRLALTGYRREYVDALDEILERDPHLFAVLTQRVLTACGARLVVTPRDPESKRCRKIADEVENQIRGMIGFRQSLAALVFSGMYYGIGCSEITWEPQPPKVPGEQFGWVAKRLHFIHSRRLSYPDPGSWDLRIWDQGQLYAWDTGKPDVDKTNALWGTPVKNYPGKFVVFSPQLRADYPTREGLGRQVAIWGLLKLLGARIASQFVERYSKPWAIATYTTTSNGTPRAAESGGGNDDVTAADNALRALGTGSLAGAVIPDSIKIELEQIAAGAHNLGLKDWLDICNREESKAVLGQTDTTDGGDQGSRARASTQKTGSDQLARFDVMLIADSLQEGLVDWIVRLNFPDDFDKRPIVSLTVDPDPDPAAVMEFVSKAATVGMPVDADDVARQIGVKLVDRDDPDGRVLVPVSPIDYGRLYPARVAEPQAPAGAEPTNPPTGSGAPGEGPKAKGKGKGIADEGDEKDKKPGAHPSKAPAKKGDEKDKAGEKPEPKAKAEPQRAPRGKKVAPKKGADE